MQIAEQVPLKEFTTFHIGGNARYFVEIVNEQELIGALSWAREKNISFFLLAGGSNLLVSDAGFDGLVIRIKNKDVHVEGCELRIDAGCNLLSTIRSAGEMGLGGWEKLAGIPGTVGGAVRGNAGAFGSEIQDFVTTVHALNTITLETKDFQNTECEFSYRHSLFKDHPEWIILFVQVRLAQLESKKVCESIEETIRERERRHLQNVRAAGSFFMNPVAPQEVRDMFETEKGVKAREGRVPAGWLIEKVGLKGERLGGAIASLQHPNYLVNESGHASAEEVRTLATKIKQAVKERFGIELEEEAVIL